MTDETVFLATVTISWDSRHCGPQFLHMARLVVKSRKSPEGRPWDGNRLQQHLTEVTPPQCWSPAHPAGSLWLQLQN